MKIFNILIFTFLLLNGVSAQTLFENDKTNGASPKVYSNSKTSSKKRAVDPYKKRYVLTNLESLILRGDLQLSYEIPQKSGWSTVLHAHANPQDDFNENTGDMGILGGGRLYFEESFIDSDIYLQGMIGFNHFSNWDLMISLEFGQRIQWKKKVFLDVGLVVNRSYAEEKKDPMAYLKINLSFEIGDPLFPFL